MTTQIDFSFPPVGSDASQNTKTSGGNEIGISRRERKRLADATYRLKNREALKLKDRQKYLRRRDIVLAQCKAKYVANPEPMKARVKSWSAANKERRKLTDQQYRKSNRKKLNAYALANYHTNPKRKAYVKKYNAAHKEVRYEQQKRIRLGNPERNNRYQAKWRKNNMHKIIARQMARYRTDLMFNLAYRIRARIRVALSRCQRGLRKKDLTIKLLGCNFIQLKAHIEKQFTEGMTWEKVLDNSIHIDHITPCAWFDLRCPVQQSYCFRWDNLQPLWALDNMKKGYK